MEAETKLLIEPESDASQSDATAQTTSNQFPNASQSGTTAQTASSQAPVPAVLPLEKIMVEICNPLLFWFFIISFVFLLLWIVGAAIKFFEAEDQRLKPVFYFGELMDPPLSVRAFGWTLVFLIFSSLLIMFLSAAPFRGEYPITAFLNKNKLSIFLFSSVVLLIFYVFLTGGILDSPFTAALSVYVGGFIVMQDRDDTNKLVRWLIGLVIVCFTVPYLFLYLIYIWPYNVNSPPFITKLTLLVWESQNPHITFARVATTFLLSVFSIRQADKINKRIDQIYGSN